MQEDGRVRRYVSEALAGLASNAAVSVHRFESGDRHAVYKVGFIDTSRAERSVVVRLSLADTAAEREQAEREAAVLAHLDGTSAPRLVDFRAESEWFDVPVMCVEFVAGHQQELPSTSVADIERLGVVVASVHDLPSSALADRWAAARTLDAYVEERLGQVAAYLPRFRTPLPPSVAALVDAALVWLDASVIDLKHDVSFAPDEPLVLIHGDIGAGNILWGQRPVLIDWEYARLGDAADEVAYVFAQEGLADPQREALWAGYWTATKYPRLEQLQRRAQWWEPVNILGSALWWLERWSGRAEADRTGLVEPSATRPATYYLDKAARLLDRFDDAAHRASLIVE